MKAVKESDDLPKNMEPPISALLYARCAEHYQVKQLNATESDGAECGACIGEEVKFLNATLLDLLDVLGARLLASSIRKDHLQRCIDRLNFVMPGAGDSMLQELANDFQQHTQRRLWIEGRHNHELRGRWLSLPNDHPMREMALAIEDELQQASQPTGEVTEEEQKE